MKKKQNKGITLVALIVTIVIMAMIATTVIFSGTKLIELTQKSEYRAQMKIIQAKVDVIYEEKKVGRIVIDNYGQNIETLSQETKNKIDIALQGKSQEGFKYFNKKDLIVMNIEELDVEVIINFETKEVININSIENK